MPTDQNNPLSGISGELTQQFQSEPSSKTPEYIGQEKTPKPMTFGEKLVGLTFNPSNDDKVSKAKKLCADLADLLMEHYNEPREMTELEGRLINHAIGEILNAQMNVVKVLTLKY
jgi:hypothetical protein